MPRKPKSIIPSSREKIARTIQHLNKLNRDIARFIGSKPYRIAQEFDAESGETRIVYHSTRPIPLRWSVVAGELIYNLRSALDHAVYDLTILEQGKPLPGTAFPTSRKKKSFYRTDPDGVTAKTGSGAYNIRGLSQKTRRVIETLQPFDDVGVLGPMSSSLRVLDDMCNIDKHRRLHLCRFGGLRTHITGNQILRVRGGIRFPLPSMLDEQTVLFAVRLDPDQKMQMNTNIFVEVVFDEPCLGSLGGKTPLLDILLALVQYTSAVLNALEVSFSQNAPPTSE